MLNESVSELLNIIIVLAVSCENLIWTMRERYYLRSTYLGYEWSADSEISTIPYLCDK
jgi:hypothetical protein